jgi:hypothetical protein
MVYKCRFEIKKRSWIYFIKNGLEFPWKYIYCNDLLNLILHKKAMENREYNKTFKSV